MFVFLKNTEKIFYIVISGGFCDLIHFFIGLREHLLCLFNPNGIQAVYKGLPGTLLEQMAAVAAVQIKKGGQEFYGQIILIVSLHVNLHLLNDVLSSIDIICFKKRGDVGIKLVIVIFYLLKAEHIVEDILHTAVGGGGGDLLKVGAHHIPSPVSQRKAEYFYVIKAYIGDGKKISKKFF